MRLRDVASIDQASQALSVLDELEKTISTSSTESVPQIHIAEVEATSTVLIEWIFPDRRLVFNIEIDAADSGWVFVTKSGEFQLGDIETANFGQLVQWSLEGHIAQNG